MKSDESLHESQATSHGSYCVRCGAWKGAYGLEPTIEMYIEHTVTILRELRRVLRKDGVLFWNIGDSYNGSWGNYDARESTQRTIRKERYARDAWENHSGWPPMANPQNGLKPKDLCLIPERVALAAQSDGWWVRSRILWTKPNPMPESVTDRPTDAAEHIWMFTKSERYFWDADAVREPAESVQSPDVHRQEAHRKTNSNEFNAGSYADTRIETYRPSMRNLRNVWTFATQPYSGAHFATFPEALSRLCILAATSAKGACAQCGAPWARVTRPDAQRAAQLGSGWHDHADDIGEGQINGKPALGGYETIGWQPTCLCRGQHGKTVPCVVLDPFGGSGTTGRVAIELNRRAILADLAYGEGDEYRRLAEERCSNVQRNLPLDVGIARPANSVPVGASEPHQASLFTAPALRIALIG